MGNTVHHFDIAGNHTQVKVSAQSTVDVQSPQPPRAAGAGSWADLDRAVAAPSPNDDHWEMLLPSQFAHNSEKLQALAKEIHCERRDTPFLLLAELNQSIYDSFDYVPNSTKVDSPIDDAIQTRQGVCQDFAHIMIAQS